MEKQTVFLIDKKKTEEWVNKCCFCLLISFIFIIIIIIKIYIDIQNTN